MSYARIGEPRRHHATLRSDRNRFSLHFGLVVRDKRRRRDLAGAMAT
jgi:hypothetical protein